MDIDEQEKTKEAAPAGDATAPATAAKDKPTPSASSESAAAYPVMSLAQDIHRLTMVHTGQLGADDAAAILGCAPADLLARVMRRVGTGEKTLAAAMADNEARHKPRGEGTTGAAPPPARAAAAADDGALLNPSLYRRLVATLGYAAPDALTAADLDALDAHHATVGAHLTAAIAAAREEAGDTEVLDAHVAVARYRARHAGPDAALAACDAVLALPKLGAGKRLDALLDAARVASFWGDRRRTDATLATAAATLATTGGDWDRRNRLQAYRALAALRARDIKGASAPLAAGIASFSCTELCPFSEFVQYAILTNLLFLKRTELKKTVVDGSEVLQVAKDIPVVLRLANTLYECDYKAYLHTLVDLQPHLVADRYLQPHAGYLLRELHVLALKQFLDSYQSVTLESMARSFGVGTEFLDVQLSRFIAAGRLAAKVDKFGGVVETNRPDWKNARYQETIQKGDLLLNRIQKLGRVVDL